MDKDFFRSKKNIGLAFIIGLCCFSLVFIGSKIQQEVQKNKLARQKANTQTNAKKTATPQPTAKATHPEVGGLLPTPLDDQAKQEMAKDEPDYAKAEELAKQELEKLKSQKPQTTQVKGVSTGADQEEQVKVKGVTLPTSQRENLTEEELEYYNTEAKVQFTLGVSQMAQGSYNGDVEKLIEGINTQKAIVRNEYYSNFDKSRAITRMRDINFLNADDSKTYIFSGPIFKDLWPTEEMPKQLAFNTANRNLLELSMQLYPNTILSYKMAQENMDQLLTAQSMGETRRATLKMRAEAYLLEGNKNLVKFVKLDELEGHRLAYAYLEKARAYSRLYLLQGKTSTTDKAKLNAMYDKTLKQLKADPKTVNSPDVIYKVLHTRIDYARWHRMAYGGGPNSIEKVKDLLNPIYNVSNNNVKKRLKLYLAKVLDQYKGREDFDELTFKILADADPRLVPLLKDAGWTNEDIEIGDSLSKINLDSWGE